MICTILETETESSGQNSTSSSQKRSASQVPQEGNKSKLKRSASAGSNVNNSEEKPRMEFQLVKPKPLKECEKFEKLRQMRRCCWPEYGPCQLRCNGPCSEHSYGYNTTCNTPKWIPLHAPPICDFPPPMRCVQPVNCCPPPCRHITLKNLFGHIC